MFLHIYIDPEDDKDMGVMNVRKPYFDNDMVHCFWVKDIKLIVLNPRSDQIKRQKKKGQHIPQGRPSV